MDVIKFIFGFQLLWGIFGAIMLVSPLGWRAARKGIEHPSWRTRSVYKFAAWGAAYFLSFCVTPVFLNKLGWSAPKDLTLLKQVSFLVLYPVPLSPIFYLSYRCIARWRDRHEE